MIEPTSASPLAPPGAAGATPPAGPNTSDPLTSKDTFLKLLVAQLQNQNPLNPADPMIFMGQLTQFSMLEQSMAMREELSGIHSAIDKLAQALKPPDTTTRPASNS